MNFWLLLDMNNMVHKSFHAFKGKDFGGEHVGTVFGVVRELRLLAERFPAAVPVFCFDLGEPHRKALLPGYKSGRNRAGTDPEDQRQRQYLRELIEVLRTDALPRLTPNVFFEEGFEADDLVAEIANRCNSKDRAIIVSSDKDLHQLLCGEIAVVWNSKAKIPLTEQWFWDEWGLAPRQWAEIKAIAGCSSDNVPGVEGVGEHLAARYLRGEMNVSTATHRKIHNFIKSGGLKQNLKLVRLPFAGCPEFRPKAKHLTERDWDRLAKALGVPTVKQGSK